jgi:hypothetical protein
MELENKISKKKSKELFTKIAMVMVARAGKIRSYLTMNQKRMKTQWANFKIQLITDLIW